MYGNEKGVGEAIARLRHPPRGAVHHQQAQQRLPRARRRPEGLRRHDRGHRRDYVDLFLIHWPLPTQYDGDFVSTWKTLIEFQKDGRARSIGVSNFQPAHLERLAQETDVVPAVNQIEVHPYFTNEAARDGQPRRRHPGRVVVPDRPGRRARRTRRSPAIADAGRTHAGPGDPALARAARRHRLPEVLDAGADGGELRDLRLRARRRRRSRRSARSTRARRAAPAPTPTSSTTSPTEPTQPVGQGRVLPGPAPAVRPEGSTRRSVTMTTLLASAWSWGRTSGSGSRRCGRSWT